MKQENGHRYDDILDLPHHVSTVHPQMSRAERAAQFSPFAALTGHEAAIRETERLTEEEAELDETVCADLDRRLRLLCAHVGEEPRITVTWFRPDTRKAGGAYEQVSGCVRKVDLYRRTLLFADRTAVPIDRIVDMDGELFAREMEESDYEYD